MGGLLHCLSSFRSRVKVCNFWLYVLSWELCIGLGSCGVLLSSAFSMSVYTLSSKAPRGTLLLLLLEAEKDEATGAIDGYRDIEEVLQKY